MTNEKLDTELLERLKLVDDPDYEGEPLTKLVPYSRNTAIKNKKLRNVF
jgi:hypothetical protein